MHRRAGGYGPGEPMEAKNFQDSYLKTVFGSIGITDVTFVHDEKTLAGNSNLPESLALAREISHEAIAIAA